MISIRKYLDIERKHKAGSPELDPHFSEALCRFSTGVLECINQFVFTGAGSEGLRSQLIHVKDTLRPDMPTEEAAAAAESVCSILVAHGASAQAAATEKLLESQHIFGMLNQALVVLAEGNDRGLARLNTIQESLQRTVTMRDIPSLRASLMETVLFIRAESVQARETAAQELGCFEVEVNNARGVLGGTRLELAGRPEGVSKISASLKNLATGEATYLVAYLCDRLTAVTQRYGVGVTDELVARLIKERLKPVMPENTMYRWTPSSLVAIFSRPRDVAKLRKEVADLNRTPLVHKMALNGRTAILTVSPSHLVAEGVSGSSDILIEQVDKFTLSRL